MENGGPGIPQRRELGESVVGIRDLKFGLDRNETRGAKG